MKTNLNMPLKCWIQSGKRLCKILEYMKEKKLDLQMVTLYPRTLIKRLEKIDPTKMAHEEQLCFWINIHNALVMHVCSIFLAIATLNNIHF